MLSTPAVIRVTIVEITQRQSLLALHIQGLHIHGNDFAVVLVLNHSLSSRDLWKNGIQAAIRIEAHYLEQSWAVYTYNNTTISLNLYIINSNKFLGR
jgi:hypothetical protein